MKKNSLIVVGTGIKCLTQITPETKLIIKQASKILYLLNDYLTEEWIKKNNKNYESLESFYRSHEPRLKVYRQITAHILKTLKKTPRLCVVFDGHPVVYAQSALNAVIRAEELGFRSKILPGISAEDCLFADLRIDPSDFGCQSYDATDFLIRERQIDNTCHLILWQIGSIGTLAINCKIPNLVGLKALSDTLLHHYPSDHHIIIYEAAQYEGFSPRKEQVRLGELLKVQFSSFSTLYIPPVKQAKLNKKILRQLNIKLSQLK